MVSLGDGAAIVMKSPFPNKIFVYLGKDLVQFDIGDECATNPLQAVEWIRNLAPADGEQILSELALCAGEADELDHFLAASAAALPRSQQLDVNSHIKLVDFVKTDEGIYLFTEVVGDALVEAIVVHRQGHTEAPLNIASYTHWVSSLPSSPASHKTTSALRIAAFAKCETGHKRAYKVIIRTDGGSVETWVKARIADGKEVGDRISGFWAAAYLNPGLMFDVVVPIMKSAAVQQRKVCRISSTEINRAKNRFAEIELQLLSDGNLEELHRSFLAFVAAPFQSIVSFKVLLTRPESSEQVLHAVTWWCEQYKLKATVNMFGPDILTGSVIRTA